ncbi:MAG: VOC family protein [Acidobacteria bacterium]|nr:VOC family protein [Acidobacteriota bacterium]MBV9474648.1 VOC family protein [Acidobacteriota bacterium]
MDSVVHFEMPYENRDRMKSFYETAFGWQTQTLGPEMGNYVVVTTTETDAQRMPKNPGAINGGFYARTDDPASNNPSVVISVSDIHDTVRRIAAGGGTLLGEPMEIPGIGMYASFRDTEGNRVGALQPFPR